MRQNVAVIVGILGVRVGSCGDYVDYVSEKKTETVFYLNNDCEWNLLAAHSFLVHKRVHVDLGMHPLAIGSDLFGSAHYVSHAFA